MVKKFFGYLAAARKLLGRWFYPAAACLAVLCVVLVARMCNSSEDTPPMSDIERQMQANDSLLGLPREVKYETDGEGRVVRRPIYSVSSYAEAFPDLNDVHLATAEYMGTRPVKDRAEANEMKSELVYVGSSPYFYVQRLTNSIPYLVPHAYEVLDEIARTFIDSLHSKQLPMHILVVTSVLRTEDDVARLRRINPNASEQSAHRFGTTFDISYNKFRSIPDHKETHSLQMKQILSEVLSDLRRKGLCYVKHEVKQGCFHITAR